METPSNPKTEDYTYKQGQYSPRKRKDTTPKVNPQLAVELVFQELKRVEAYTKRIEDATAKKVEIDRGSLESAENRLKNVLADFERQGNRMKNGSYVDKKVSMYSILCAFFSLLGLLAHFTQIYHLYNLLIYNILRRNLQLFITEFCIFSPCIIFISNKNSDKSIEILHISPKYITSVDNLMIHIFSSTFNFLYSFTPSDRLESKS